MDLLERFIIKELKGQANKINDLKALEKELDSSDLDEKEKRRKILQFLIKGTPFIAKGSSRMVFKLDDDRVIKFAHNNKGIAQNKVESNPQLQSRYGDIVAKVYDRSPNYYWLESEYVTQAEPDQWANRLGLATHSEFKNYLANVLFYDQASPQDKKQFEKKYQAWLDSIVKRAPEAYEMLQLAREFSMKYGDFAHNNLGFSTQDGRPVILDYGFDAETAKKHYSKPKPDMKNLFNKAKDSDELTVKSDDQTMQKVPMNDFDPDATPKINM
jgi:hypothetical protein